MKGRNFTVVNKSNLLQNINTVGKPKATNDETKRSWKEILVHLLSHQYQVSAFRIQTLYRDFIPITDRSCSKMINCKVVVGANLDQIGMNPRQKVSGPSCVAIL